MISKTVYAPNYPKQTSGGVDIFLAGSIEMGKADNWQPRVTAAIESLPKTGFIYNPRRLDFQEDAVQSITNPYFREQVEWELDHLKASDIVFMYLEPSSKSPISLMELGFLARDNNLIVCCPDGFWRKGNVEILCRREQIPFFNNIEYAIASLKWKISQTEK